MLGTRATIMRMAEGVPFGHDGGDDGVATVCFFDPETDVGVVALANGNWRTVKGQLALYLIMDRLFEAAPQLG